MTGASFSACGKYRYSLTRTFGGADGRAVFIMLNPSTADATQDDPTIRRCIGFAKAWNCGELVVLNLFAIRATDPAVMLADADPEGPDNEEHFRRYLAGAQHAETIIVCAWGAHGKHRNQGRKVMGWLQRWDITPECLGVTKDGQPKHPLYLAGKSVRIPYRVA